MEATTKSEVCLFMCEPMVEAVRQYLQVRGEEGGGIVRSR